MTTYLALSKSGRVVASFDSPRLGMTFVARQAKAGVTVQLFEETTTRRLYAPAMRLVAGGRG